MKMDDLHQSDFRDLSQKGTLICILFSNGHLLGCLFEVIYSFLAKGLAVPILWQTNPTSVN